MALKLIVTVKQVPDTADITGQAMKEDGTVNREALPAILNPEDLNALEEALKLKELHGGEITVLSMGPPSASEALKECLSRGADRAVLLSDRKFAGGDTLATSLTLALAIGRLGDWDIIFCGRQAIDGDTAQVGPQLAEKLGLNQVTYVSEVTKWDPSEKRLYLERTTEYGIEKMRVPLPLLITVTAAANTPRPPHAKLVLALKEREFSPRDKEMRLWTYEDIAEGETLGMAGSPTMVKAIENVVLTVGKSRMIEPSEASVRGLVDELREDHIIG